MKELKMFFVTRLIVGATTFSIILCALAFQCPSIGTKRNQDLNIPLMSRLEEIDFEYNQMELALIPILCREENTYSYYWDITFDRACCCSCSIIVDCSCELTSM